MTQEEWLKEFERLNGRPATQEEFASVWGVPVQAPQSVAPEGATEPVAPAQPAGFVPQESYVPPVGGAMPEGFAPAPKKSKKGLWIGISALIIAVLAIAGFFWWQGSRNSINGTWHSTQETSQELVDQASNGTLGDYLRNVNLNLQIENNQVTMSMDLSVDIDQMAEDMAQRSYSDSEDKEYYLNVITNQFTSDGTDVVVDVNQGRIFGTQFKGVLDPTTNQITIQDPAVSSFYEGETLSYQLENGILRFSLNGQEVAFSK